MLWDIVFKFFVQYIFGGIIYDGTSVRSYYSTVGRIFVSDGGLHGDLATITIDLFNYRFPLGNYLSLIATIITMVVILVLCCALIKKIYNICAHVIG